LVRSCSVSRSASAPTRRSSCVTETGLAIFVLVAFVIPVPILVWLDRKPRVPTIGG
jgi:hypothetical protein